MGNCTIDRVPQLALIHLTTIVLRRYSRSIETHIGLLPRAATLTSTHFPGLGLPPCNIKNSTLPSPTNENGVLLGPSLLNVHHAKKDEMPQGNATSSRTSQNPAKSSLARCITASCKLSASPRCVICLKASRFCRSSQGLYR